MGLDKIKALLQIKGDELRKMAAALVIWAKSNDDLKYLTYDGAVHYAASYTYDFDAAEALVRKAIETARTTPSSFKDALEAEIMTYKYNQQKLLYGSCDYLNPDELTEIGPICIVVGGEAVGQQLREVLEKLAEKDTPELLGVSLAEAVANMQEAFNCLPTMEEAAENARRNMRAINGKARNEEVKKRGRNTTNGRKKDFRRRRT